MPNNRNFSNIQLAINHAVNDYLKANNMYQRGLAKQMGKTDSMICYTLSGKQNFTIAALIEIGKAIGKEVKIEFVEPSK
jgi:predicted XRE-type DNA-binding protein